MTETITETILKIDELMQNPTPQNRGRIIAYIIKAIELLENRIDSLEQAQE